MGKELRESPARGWTRQEAGFTQFLTQKYTLLSVSYVEGRREKIMKECNARMLFSAGWRPFAALCSEQSRFSYCRKKVAFSTAFKGKGVVSGPSRSNSTSLEEGSETLLPSFLPSTTRFRLALLAHSLAPLLLPTTLTPGRAAAQGNAE